MLYTPFGLVLAGSASHSRLPFQDRLLPLPGLLHSDGPNPSNEGPFPPDEPRDLPHSLETS